MAEKLVRRGVDVSMHNGDIDWKKVKKGPPAVGFAFVKATEGLGYVDPLFTSGRVRALRDAGIPFGPYHFARPQPGRDGADEAKFFVEAAKSRGWGRKGDLRGVLDIEHADRVSASEVRRFVARFVRRYVQLTGHRPIIYTGHFWRDFMGNPIMLTKCPLWLAAYTRSWRPWMPKAWVGGRPHFWQRTETGRQPGISGHVDVNRFLRNRKQWRRMKLPRDLEGVA